MTARITRAVLLLVANAIGLFVASVALDKLTIGWRTFVIAVVIFTVVEVVAQPLIERVVRSKAEAFAGGAVLLSTLVGLVVTNLISDGIAIEGLGTWILATVIVWVVAVLAGVILPGLLARRGGQGGAHSPA